MGQAEQSIQHVCSLRSKASKGLGITLTEFKPYYEILIPENLVTHCREWPAGTASVEVQVLVKANSKPRDIAIYTDGLVTSDQPWWGLTVKQGGRTVLEDSGAHRAGVSGNKRADRMASTTYTTSGLQLGRKEVLRGLGNFLNMDRLEHHRMDHQEERGVEKGSGRHSILPDRERSVFNQTNIGPVITVTGGRLLRDGVGEGGGGGGGRVWVFPSATKPS